MPFLDKLLLETDGKEFSSCGNVVWTRVADCRYQDKNGVIHTALAGTKTDLASIPRTAATFALIGKFPLSANIHDALYDAQVLPRERCDELLLEMMEVEGGVNAFEREAVYFAVREFGGTHWKS